MKVDVRIVAATHRDLEKEVKAGRFRQDLLFRLQGHPDPRAAAAGARRGHPRAGPVLPRKVSAECRRNFKLTPAAMRKLQAYPWPGNVRQLRAALESAAVMSDADMLDADALPLAGGRATRRRRRRRAAPTCRPSLDMDEIETWAIRRALRQTGGNVSHAAQLLGMSRDTLHTKLKKKGIDRDALLNPPEPVMVD